MSRPNFPDILGRREVNSPGASAHKAGPTVEERLAALERGALAIPGVGVPNGSSITSDTSQAGGVAWSPFRSVAWTEPTYATGWSSHGATYGPPKYAKSRDGIVSLRGLAVKANNGGSSATIFTLPVGCRPPINLIFVCPCSVGGEYYCHLYVLSNGQVNMTSYTTTGAVVSVAPSTVVSWVSLNPIEFDTAV